MNKKFTVALIAPFIALAFVSSAFGQDSGSAPSSAACSMTTNLARGSNDGNVVTLQNFLRDQGFFTGTSVRSFGPKTFNAVAAFQRANKLPSTGFVGVMTRAFIKGMCGTTTGGTTTATKVKIYSMTPRMGPIGTEVTIDGFGFTSNNIIHFGNGVVVHVPVSSQIAIACTTDPNCIGGIHQRLVFEVPSSINPACLYTFPMCAVASMQTQPGAYNVSVSNTNGTSDSTTFTVTGTNTAGVQINSITPISGAALSTVTLTGTGFDKTSVLRFGGSSIAYTTSADGTSLMFSVPNSVGAYCKPNEMCPMYMRLVTPGSYDVFVQNPDGTIVSNTVSFAVTNGSSNGTLSINGIDAPSTLALGTGGTWTVHASASSLSPNLHYAVVWGDEMSNASAAIMMPAPHDVQSSATFSHAYQRSGTFTPTFTVTDDAGHSATVSATVVVTPLY